jgi:hypothetical protein
MRRELSKLGFFKDAIRIVYQGRGVSLNQFYQQGHWSTRSRIKIQYRSIFDKLLKQSTDLRWLEQFYLCIFFNSGHDTDNVVGMSKVFVDSLKREYNKDLDIITREGLIPDDDKAHFKGLMIFPDEKMPHNTFEFLLIPYNGN